MSSITSTKGPCPFPGGLPTHLFQPNFTMLLASERLYGKTSLLDEIIASRPWSSVDVFSGTRRDETSSPLETRPVHYHNLVRPEQLARAWRDHKFRPSEDRDHCKLVILDDLSFQFTNGRKGQGLMIHELHTLLENANAHNVSVAMTVQTREIPSMPCLAKFNLVVLGQNKSVDARDECLAALCNLSADAHPASTAHSLQTLAPISLLYDDLVPGAGRSPLFQKDMGSLGFRDWLVLNRVSKSKTIYRPHTTGATEGGWCVVQ